MVRLLVLFIAFAFSFNLWCSAAEKNDLQNSSTNYTIINSEVHFPEIVMQGIESEIEIFIDDPNIKDKDKIEISINQIKQTVPITNGKGVILHTFEQPEICTITIADESYEKDIHPIPLWLSVIPPLIAILMALIFREVYSSLFIGLLFGSLTISLYADTSIFGFFTGLYAIIDQYIIAALTNRGHVSIIVFSMLIGGMVGIITKNGGMKGIVNYLSKYANNAVSGQIVTWFLGIAIFFDDYANTLVVGNTMRSVTDKLKISREKLSYIVDSTAAPVAAIAFITTWIGAELGYIEHTSNHIPEISSQVSVYSIFVNSLQYSFYPILTLIFIFILTMKKRDFGPMYKAEERARTSGEVKKKDSQSMNNEVEELNPAEHVKPRGINALIPILTIIIGTITGLFITGKNACYTDLSSIIPNLNDSFTSVWGSLQELPNNPHTFIQKLGTIIGASDSYSALLWSSLSGVLIAVLLTVSQRILKLDETINSAIKGFKTMLNAVLILVLAWSLAKITENLHTADFITSLLGEGFKPWLVPALSFVLAALVAFSTGSSWGTMAILYPLVLPAAWKVCQLNGFSFDESMMIFNNVVSTVLAGSVLGDHCSPISDTTILSSLASSCNHIDHVKTQLPYALTVGLVAVVFGTIPSALGVSSLILFPVTIAVLYGIIHFLGKKLPE